jgi:hypothetical protein
MMRWNAFPHQNQPKWQRIPLLFPFFPFATATRVTRSCVISGVSQRQPWAGMDWVEGSNASTGRLLAHRAGEMLCVGTPKNLCHIFTIATWLNFEMEFLSGHLIWQFQKKTQICPDLLLTVFFFFYIYKIRPDLYQGSPGVPTITRGPALHRGNPPGFLFPL